MKKEKDLSKQVMKEIKQKDIKMRPKLYFVAGSLLLGAGMAGAIVLAMFFTHLVMFRLRVHAPFAFLQLGQPGLRAFLVNLPWRPLLLTIGGLAGGISLLRRYEISYKKSFLVLVIGLVALVFTFGFLLDQIRPEKRLAGLRPIRPLYEARFKGHDWVVGEVREVKEGELTVQTPEGKEVIVVWDEKTRMPLGVDFQKGDQIRAVGEWQNGSLKTKGIVVQNGFSKIKPFGRQKLKPR